MNATARWRARILPTIRDYYALRQRLPDAPVFSLAALLEFYRDPSMPVSDDPAVVDAIRAVWGSDDEIETKVMASLREMGIAGEATDLPPEFGRRVAEHLERVERLGIRASLDVLANDEVG